MHNGQKRDDICRAKKKKSKETSVPLPFLLTTLEGSCCAPCDAVPRPADDVACMMVAGEQSVRRHTIGSNEHRKVGCEQKGCAESVRTANVICDQHQTQAPFLL